MAPAMAQDESSRAKQLKSKGGRDRGVVKNAHGNVQGRTREDEADIPPTFEEGSKYQENISYEYVQQALTCLQKKTDAECKEKDAETGQWKRAYEKKDAECKEKDAETGQWKKAYEKKDAECKKKDAETGQWKKAYEKKDAECKEKDAETGQWKKAYEQKDAELGRLKDELDKATEELQRGNATPSKDATPASDDDPMDWAPTPPYPGV